MTHEELEAKLAQANEAAGSGNFDQAEQLANEALAQTTPRPLDTPLYERGESEHSPSSHEGVAQRLRSNGVVRALLLLGNVYRLSGNFPAALERYAAAQAAAEAVNDTSGIAKAMNGCGIVYLNLGSYDKSLEYYVKALAAHEELGEKSEVARVTGNIGIVYSSLGSYDKALEYFAKALAVHEELGAKSGVALVTGNIGIVYRNLGSYDKALEYYGKALAAHEELGEKSSVARVTGNIGLVYYSLGSYDKALEYYGKALAAHEELGEKSSVATVTGNIGNVYQSLGSYDKALEYYGKSLAAHEELGEKSSAARVTGNIGTVYNSLGSYDKALEYYAKALAAHEELGLKSEVARVTGNIGIVYYSLGSHDTALEYFGRALAAHEELGEQSSVANVTGNIGEAYFELKDYAKALDLQKRALAMAEEIGDRRLTGYWSQGIGNTLSAMGKKQEAMEYLYKALHLLRDELQTNAGVAHTLIAIGTLLAEQNKSDEALEKLEEGLALAEELGEKAQAFKAHKELYKIRKKKGNIASALSHFEKYHNLKEEVQSEEAKKTAQKQDIDRQAAEREKQIAIERTRATAEKNILNNILPEEITARLIKGENPIADHFDSVSVLFMDIVDFTPLASSITAQQLVHLLNAIFSAADGVMRECGLEKIKTIGDAYMAVAGAPTAQEDHAHRAAEAALKLRNVMQNLVVTFPENYGDRSWIASVPEIQVRIGLHCGSAAAGVVGENKFLYDLWGDAVNTASRMESHGEEDMIHVSEEFRNAVGESSFTFIERGEMDIKGKGTMKTYFLEKKV